MRSLLVVLTGACASLSTSLVVWVAVANESRVYYEVLDGGLVQTTASENQVNLAVAAALEARRAKSSTVEQELVGSAYCEKASAWYTEPNLFGQTAERASRLERSQVDRDGKRIEVESLRVADETTLVFVHHEDESVKESVALWIGNELAHQGVDHR